MPAGYTWRPIEDYESDPGSLSDRELESLWRVWVRQKSELTELDKLDELEKRLRREWSIETGVIEGAYTLERGVTRTLIERGIDAALIPHDATDRDTTLVARIIQDHYDALEGMFDFVGGQRELSTSYIKELHAALLRNVETHTVVDQFGRAFEKKLEKGTYKTTPNSPTGPDSAIHEYCPPEHVASEMDRLILLYREHQTRTIPVEVEAAWLHHRFTQIHPFEDGNGRVARALATLVFIKAGWFPLIIKRDDARYYDASLTADRGDLRPLIAMFGEAQRTALIQATDGAYEAKPVASAEEAIAAARDRLLQRGRLPLSEWVEAKKTADVLIQLTQNRLAEIARELTGQIAAGSRGFGFSANGGKPEGADNVRSSVVSRAIPSPDFEEYSAVWNLNLAAGHGSTLTVSFQGIGPRYRGVIGVVAYFGPRGMVPALLPVGTFQINYEEAAEVAQKRFGAWLERAIVAGLTEWRRTL